MLLFFMAVQNDGFECWFSENNVSAFFLYFSGVNQIFCGAARRILTKAVFAAALRAAVELYYGNAAAHFVNRSKHNNNSI